MDDKKRSEQLDDFWDISDLVPKRSPSFGCARSVAPVDIELTAEAGSAPQKEQASSTVIKRFIPPNSEGRLTAAADAFEAVDTYVPRESLIHSVTIKKIKCTYQYYQEFLADAKRYVTRRGSPCEYISFFSYVPQYDQMNDAQLSYYFWFREAFLRGERIRIDLSYVMLWIFERINLGSLVDVKESQWILTELWNVYHLDFPGLASKLADWICDFSLIHQLPPPDHASPELVKSVISLKEFYISVPDYDISGCVRSLLKYCSYYDFHSSKFATGENLALFEHHVPQAVAQAVAYYSADGKILSGLTFEDSQLQRDAFAGALCVADQKYRIELRYCSFSRSNELRYLVGDVVKYAENKLRAYLSIKSKMTVYSLPTELQRRIDAYFALHLPGKKPSVPKRVVQEYDALYELPKKKFSLDDASRIEAESWQTTDKLVSAFEEEPVMEPQELPTVAQSDKTEDGLRAQLGEYCAAVLELTEGKHDAITHLAERLGKMPETVVDEINEIAFEAFGDALLEECDGGYAIVEDYKEYLEE